MHRHGGVGRQGDDGADTRRKQRRRILGVLLTAGGAGVAVILVLLGIVFFWPDAPRAERIVVNNPAPTPAAPQADARRFVFSPDRHLLEFDRRHGGKYGHLYELDELVAWQGKAVTAQQLATFRKLWDSERQRVDARIEELESNPEKLEAHEIDRGIAALKQRLAHHAFFKKVDHETIHELPFLFLVENPRKEDPEYSRQVTDRFLPWLREIETIFESRYVEPLELEKRGDHDFYAISILATRGSYIDFATAVRDPLIVTTGAHYNPFLRLAVTYEDPFTNLDVDHERRSAVLHEFVHALQHAYSRGSDGLPRPVWVNEGLAEYLAAREATSRESLRDAPVEARQLTGFFDVLHSDVGRHLVHPVRDLVSVSGPGYRDIMNRAVARLPVEVRERLRHGSRAALMEWTRSAKTAFYMQSCLAMHFLHSRFEKEIFAYLGRVFRGEHGWRPFAEAFAGHDPSALDEEFIDWVREEYVKRHPNRGLPAKPRLVQASPEPSLLEIGKAILERLTQTDTSDTKPAADATRRGFDPTSLRLTSAEWREQLASCVFLASMGRTEEALSRLRLFVSALDTGKASARLAREVERLSEVIALRGRIFAVGEEARYTTGERVLRGRVESVDGATVHLRDGSTERSLDLSRMTANELLRTARLSKKLGSLRWISAYLMLLDGEPPKRAERFLDRDTPSAETLRGDMDDYTALLELGEPASIVDSLARGGVTAKERSAVVLEELRTLRSRHGGVEIVRNRKEPLRAFAADLFEMSFDPARRECLGVSVEPEALPDGRVHLRYDFSSAAQSDDFVEDADYLSELRREITRDEPSRKLPPGQRSSFAIRRGALEGSGASCLRYALPFAAPFEVRYTVTYGIRRDIEVLIGDLIVGVCDDGNGNAIRCFSHGGLDMVDGGKYSAAQPEKELQPTLAQPYAFEIRHDGKTVESRVAGATTAKLAAGSRTRGVLFFWVHANVPVSISKLEIIATLDDSLLAGRRKAWVEEQLEGF